VIYAIAIPAIILWLGMAAFFAWLLWSAPEGHQDDTGFHLGRPDHQPDTALDTPRADLCTPAVGESGGGVFSISSHGAVTSAEGQHDHG